MAADEASRPEGVRLPSLAVSDALRATFSLYRRHFWTFALVMAVVAIPTFVFAVAVQTAAALQPVESSRRMSRPSTTPDRIVDIADGMLGALAVGAVVVASADALRDKRPTVRIAYRAASRRFWALVISTIILSIPMGPLRLGPLLAASHSPFLVIGWLIVGLLIVVGWQFVYQTMLLEGTGVLGAFGRSWRLSGGWRLTIVACLAPILAIQWLATIMPVIAVSFLRFSDHHPSVMWAEMLFEDERLAVAASSAFFRLITLPGEILTGSLVPILTTVLYIRLRAREAARSP